MAIGTSIGVSTSSSSFISSVVSGVTVAVCVTVSYITPISQSASPTADIKLPVANISSPMVSPQLSPSPPMFTAPMMPAIPGMLQSFQGLQPIISVNVSVQKMPTEAQNIPAPATTNAQNTAGNSTATTQQLPTALAQELKAFAESNNLPPEATIELEKGVTAAMQEAANQMQNAAGNNPEGQSADPQNNPSGGTPDNNAGSNGAQPTQMMSDGIPAGGMPQLGEMPAGEMPAFALPGMPNMPAMPEGLANAFNAIQGIPVLPPGIGSVPLLSSGFPPGFDPADIQNQSGIGGGGIGGGGIGGGGIGGGGIGGGGIGGVP